jgi:hypothetical protein
MAWRTTFGRPPTSTSTELPRFGSLSHEIEAVAVALHGRAGHFNHTSLLSVRVEHETPSPFRRGLGGELGRLRESLQRRGRRRELNVAARDHVHRQDAEDSEGEEVETAGHSEARIHGFCPSEPLSTRCRTEN